MTDSERKGSFPKKVFFFFFPDRKGGGKVVSNCDDTREPISGGPRASPPSGAEHKYLRLIHEANINAIWAFALF